MNKKEPGAARSDLYEFTMIPWILLKRKCHLPLTNRIRFRVEIFLKISQSITAAKTSPVMIKSFVLHCRVLDTARIFFLNSHSSDTFSPCKRNQESCMIVLAYFEKLRSSQFTSIRNFAPANWIASHRRDKVKTVRSVVKLDSLLSSLARKQIRTRIVTEIRTPWPQL